MRVRALLAAEPFDAVFADAPLLAQVSSLGRMSQPWLQEFQESFSAGRCSGGACALIFASRCPQRVLLVSHKSGVCWRLQLRACTAGASIWCGPQWRRCGRG